MRIKKIEFENLNSLKGKWSIDFTHPDYAAKHDIFVIYGPTGSGKTTILDAITLALYGRTPRLKAINNGVAGNEIMTRGTFSCCAKVYYSCKKGNFSSEFSQSRAKSGKLQKTDYIITNLDTNQVTAQAGNNTSLEEETTKIVQLDYNQFCRSIMLAQGEFNKFISGTADERAAILEKLTGTERYRQIAQKVWDNFREIKADFNLKQAEKHEKEKLILSDEDEKSAHKREEELARLIEDLNEKIEKTEVELRFFEQYETLKNKVENAQNQKNKLENQLILFKKDEDRLSLAEKAKNCESEYVTVFGERKNLHENQNQIAQLEQNIHLAEKNYASAVEDESKSLEMLSAAEKKFASDQEIWKKVRDLDSKIFSSKKNLDDSEKRKNDAEKTFKTGEGNQKKLAEKIEILKKNLCEAEKYIESNKNDENLVQVLAKIDTLKSSVDEQSKVIRNLSLEKSEFLAKKDENQKKRDEAKKELAEIEAEILRFVSAQSLVIAKILKSDLADGSPCPVCGSVYHKNHEEEAVDVGTKQKIGEESKNLTEKQEKFTKKIQAIEDELKNLQGKLENAEKNLSSAENFISKNLGEINESILPWKMSADSSNLSEIFKNLNEKSRIWEEKKSEKDEAENQKNANEAELKAISENLKLQKTQFEKTFQEFALLNDENQKLLSERHEIFGEKNADDEENAEKRKIEKLKTDSENAKNAKHECEVRKSNLEANKRQIEKNISELTVVLGESEKKFADKLAKNGFESEKNFVDARMGDDEYSKLVETRENLKKQKTQVETTLSEAKKSLSDFEKNHKIPGSKNELSALKTELTQKRKESNDERSEIMVRLASNEQNRQQFKKICEEYKKLQEDFATWEQMSKFVGKADGSDFSNFVQSLTAPSLLKLTNSKLKEITKRFKILLRNPLKLEFEIEDIHSDKTGSIENLSGGEKFIVSLAFALGISEFASKNVRVDSLFLDEGFGTLSGEPLEKSIEVLKNLEKQGKMLGIITHVNEVIDKIEQKIKVEPVSCGHSKIEGSGVAHY